MKKCTKFIFGSLAALTGGYLFAIAPGHRKTALMDKLQKYNYAHRGLYDNSWGIPENSMTAFKRAVEKNYGMELDIHLTKDHRLVVFHDDNLWRMCHVKKDICDMTYDELKEIHLLDTQETIPLFEDVLKLVNGRVPLIVELKVDRENYTELCQAANLMLSAYDGDYCIESFHPMAVYWFRKNNKTVIRGQLSCNFRKEPRHWKLKPLALTHLVSNFLTRPDFIAYNFQDITQLSFILNHKLFKAMTVLWTVPNEEDMQTLKKLGHTVIFEHFEP